MSQRAISPGRRLRPVSRVVLMLVTLLAAAACTLNAAPGGTQVAVISGAPEVQLAAPPSDAVYLEGVGVNVQAFVTNAGADIDRVEIVVDGSIVATLPDPNAADAPAFSLTHTWTAAGEGEHEIGVTAFRADGSSSETRTVSIEVVTSADIGEATEEATLEPEETEATEEATEVETEPVEETEDAQADEQALSQQEEESEDEPEPTETPGTPIATFTQGVNVRRGPGTNFAPPIGSFAAGQTADVLGRNPAGDWYKVRYYNAEGWVFASLLTISGDTSNLPVDPGPPTPIPATPTPVPPTEPPAPQTSANLVAGIIRINPSPPTCGETFSVNVDIANLGSEDTTTGGTFTVQDIYDGQVQAETQGPIPVVEDGETEKSADIPLTVSTWYDAEHTLVIVLNPSGSIPETTSDDNRAELRYTLQRGDC